MKVLYCNPVFFEYRLPFYKELVRLFKENFYVMYSPVRYRICKKEYMVTKIEKELGENAISLNTDHLFDTNSKKWDVMPDIEKGKRIPFTYGLMRIIRKINPDVLITEGYFQWTPLVLLYGIIHKIPVYMYYERTCWTERNANRLKTLQRKLFNRLFKGFLVNGEETKKYLLSLGVNRERIHLGGMSADANMLRAKVEEYRQTKGRFARKKMDDGLDFLFTGVVAERKGIRYLLAAWKEHVKTFPNDRFTIVGDGNLLDECQLLCVGMNSVQFEGRVAYDDIYKYYACADVYILPTIEDNWSLVIPEAMACGLPVATSIYNGCHKELVHDGINGYIFDTFKQDSIIEVLAKFHSSDLGKMGQNSIKLEEPFNTYNCAKRVYKILTKDTAV